MLFCLKSPYPGPTYDSRWEINDFNSIQQMTSIFYRQGFKWVSRETKMNSSWLLSLADDNGI